MLYNMSVKNIFDPLIYQKFESCLKTASETHMNSRIAFGALFAYYKSNYGTRFGIDFWTSKIEENILGVHA